MTTEEELKILEKVPIKECGEAIVNVHDYNKDIVIDLEETSKRMQNLGDNVCFVRKSVAEKLDRIQKSIIKQNLRLKIVDAYRPLSAQAAVYKEIYDKVRMEHQELSEEDVRREVSKWVADPNKVPPHSTGGTVDITIVGADGAELDMGTALNYAGEKAKTYFNGISENARMNRQILIEAMSSEDFVNYLNEWWHWSYGDRRWGAAKSRESIYNSI